MLLIHIHKTHICTQKHTKSAQAPRERTAHAASCTHTQNTHTLNLHRPLVSAPPTQLLTCMHNTHTHTHTNTHTHTKSAQASRERTAHAAAYETVRGALEKAAAEQSLIDGVARRKVASEQVRASTLSRCVHACACVCIQVCVCCCACVCD